MKLRLRIFMLMGIFTAALHPALSTTYSALLTEQSHPKTAQLSTILQEDTLQGLKVLLSVDEDLLDPLTKFEASKKDELAGAFYHALTTGGQIIFVGSGSSGRAGNILSNHFERARQHLNIAPSYRRKVLGKIAGGAIAMIKAQENFEDNEESGKQLAESISLSPKDIVVPISASSSATFNVGISKAARKAGATVYYFFNIDSDPFDER